MSFWAIVLALSALIFLMNIDYTMVNLALAPVSQDLNVDLNIAQWMMSAYVLIWGGCVIPFGRLSDTIGMKKTLIGGLFIFCVGSLMAGYASSIEMIILGRIIQGVGGAAMSPTLYAMVYSHVPPAHQGTAMGILIGVGGFGLACGPALGGYILDHFSWRWIFYMNLPIGFIVWIAVSFLAPADSAQKSNEKLDIPAVSLLSLALIIFMVGINQMEVWGLNFPMFLTMTTGFVLTLLFFQRDKKQGHTTLPLQIITNRKFMALCGGVAGQSFVFSSLLVLTGLYFQSVLKLNAAEAGILFLPFTLAMGVFSPFGGKIGDKFGMKMPILSGQFLCILGLSFVFAWAMELHLPFIALALTLTGIGLGISFACVNTAMFQMAPPALLSTASGVFTMLMMLGNTLGVIVSTSLTVLIGRKKMVEAFHEKALVLSPDHQKTLENLIAYVDHKIPSFLKIYESSSVSLEKILDESFLQGMAGAVVLSLVIAFISTAILHRATEAS